MISFTRTCARSVPARVVALLSTVFLLAGTPAGAESNNSSSEKLREAVTIEAVRAHQAALQEIANSAGGNRFAGTQGHDESAQYVIDQLTAAGYTPTVQEFTYAAFFENTPSQLDQLSPTATTYVNGIDFRVMSYSGSGDIAAPLGMPWGDRRGCYASDYIGYAVGNIALVERGTPAGFPGACTFRVKVNQAQAAGATGILIYNNVPGVLNGTLGAAGGLSTIPALGLTQSLGQSLATQLSGGPVTFHMRTDTRDETLTTRNVFAETPGDPTNVVMAGAHLDSVTAGPGINDNGSGSAAILETAIQMAKSKPRNQVRFAWWSAEESGLVGSNYYINSLPQTERDKIALYLNFDMIGSPNFVRFVYDGDNSAGGGSVGPAGSEVIESLFVDYFSTQGLVSEPTPFNGRSDYGPFIAVGIPAGGLFTGAEGVKTAAQALVYGGTAGIAYDPCYHAACDTYANVDTMGLDQMTDAVAHAVITFAQNTSSVNDVKGKGNAKGSPSGSSGSGSGGGGGLHDDHEEEHS